MKKVITKIGEVITKGVNSNTNLNKRRNQPKGFPFCFERLYTTKVSIYRHRACARKAYEWISV